MLLNQTVWQTPLIESIWPGRSLARHALLVIGTSFLLALSAQIAIPLPYSPVPITSQTLVVLLAGAVLGSRLGSLGVVVYITEGAIGLPFFAKGGAGVAYLRGATGGYLLGFILAAFVVGWLVERGWGQHFPTTVVTMVTGNVLLYCCGLLWLQYVLHSSFEKTLTLGLYPFVLGDLYKIGLASTLLPVLWHFFGRPKGY